MNCLRQNTLPSPRLLGRKGILLLGPLREIFTLSCVIGIILGGVVSWKDLLKPGPCSKENVAQKPMTRTVRSLEIDQDRHTLYVQSWPNELCAIDLGTGSVTAYHTPESPVQVSDFAASETNSVKLIVTESTSSNLYPKQIHIIRGDQLIRVLDCPPEIDTLSEVCLAADGSVAAFISDGGAVVGIDLTTEEFVQWHFHLSCPSFASGISPDGRLVFSTDGDANSAIYDLRTGEILAKLGMVQGCNRGIVWSNDGKYLAVSSVDGSICVFDAADGRLAWRHKLEFLFARSLAISSDGRFLAVGGFEKQIQLWEIAQEPTKPDRVIEVAGVPHNLKFNDTSLSLITGNDDGSIQEWSLSTGHMIRQLR